MLAIRTTGKAEYGRHAKALVYGEPGAGKTIFGSTAPKPLFVSLEAGLMSIAHKNIPFVEPTDSTDLHEILMHLKSGKHEFATVVIDTLDELQKVLIQERLRKTRAENLDLQGWGWVGEQLQKILRAYRNLPMNVILLCHAKVDTDQSTGIQTIKPALSGQIADQIAGYVDLSAYLSAQPVRDGEVTRMVRGLNFAPNPRMPHVKDRSGRLPGFYELNLETDFQDLIDIIFPVGEPPLAEGSVVTELRADVEEPEIPVEEIASGGSGGPAIAASKEKVEEPKAEKPRKAAPKKTATPKDPIDDEALAVVTETLGAMLLNAPVEAPKCADCDTKVEDEDLVDLAKIRYRKVLCQPHFAAAKK